MSSVLGLLLILMLTMLFVVLVEPHLYRRFGNHIVGLAFRIHVADDSPGFKSRRGFEIWFRVSSGVLLGILLVILYVALFTSV